MAGLLKGSGRLDERPIRFELSFTSAFFFLTRTLPVGLADSYASMRIEVGSAYTLVFFLVILPVLWALQFVASHFQKRYGTA